MPVKQHNIQKAENDFAQVEKDYTAKLNATDDPEEISRLTEEYQQKQEAYLKSLNENAANDGEKRLIEIVQ